LALDRFLNEFDPALQILSSCSQWLPARRGAGGDQLLLAGECTKVGLDFGEVQSHRELAFLAI